MPVTLTFGKKPKHPASMSNDEILEELGVVHDSIIVGDQVLDLAALDVDLGSDETKEPGYGEPHECLVLCLNEEQGRVIAYTGTYLAWAVPELGAIAIEEMGLHLPSEAGDAPGYYVMRNGKATGGYDYEGHPNDPELSGEWAPAVWSDFVSFGVPHDMPEEWRDLTIAIHGKEAVLGS